MSFEISSPIQDPPEALSHDKFFKTLFRVFFRDLIELLNQGLADCLDLDQVEFVAETVFADFKLHGHKVPDLVGKASTSEGDPRFVILHIETENRFTAEMEERMWLYHIQLWLKYRVPVVSLVVFLHGGPAGAQRQEVRQCVGPWECNRFAYMSFGLSGSLAEEWLERPQVLAAALAALMTSHQWDKVEQKLNCLRVIAKEEDQRRQFLLKRAVDVYLPLEKEEERARYEAALASERDEVKSMVITLDDAIAESEARGEAVGSLKGTRHAIELMLTHRFGSTPDSIVQRLAAVSELSRLHELLEFALEARSLAQFEAVFEPGAPVLPS